MATASSNSMRKIALVIGNGEYTHGQNLPNAIKDAKDITAALKRIDFIIHEPKLNQTYRDMRMLLTDFECSIEKGDLIMFYFAGHGIQCENQNYLIPSDNHLIADDKLYRHAINAQHFLNSLNSREPLATIFILDCCRRYHCSRNNELDKPVRFINTHQAGQPVEITGDESLIIFSCSDGTVADEGSPNENSLFTKHLLKHIETPNVRLMDMFMDVIRDVKREAKLEQIPKIYTSLTHRHICLASSKQQLNMKSKASTSKKMENPSERRHRNTVVDDHINILLLGQPGVGKTTFINALANYLVYNSLDEAIEGQLQVLIPASFLFTDPETFETETITTGKPNAVKNNSFEASYTEECHSYVFQIGTKKLRLINMPSIDDARGLSHDDRNYEDMVAYISQFEHLNGICIFMKPDKERIDPYFKFVIQELLRHLHVATLQNIMFIFTNARLTFYKPGPTQLVLRILLKNIKEKSGIEIPFTYQNSYMLDNEAFRYLMICKNGISFDSYAKNDYGQSWKRSILEISRLMKHIMSCAMCGIGNIVSLHKTQQLIRNLSRPISDIAVLIQENIELAKQHNDRIVTGNTLTPEVIPQKNVTLVPLQDPRIVCTNEKCIRVGVANDINQVEYVTHCHPKCYCVQGVAEEILGHKNLKQCIVFDKSSGFCKKCGCSWKRHIRIKYEINKSMVNVVANSSYNNRRSLRHNKRYIEDLKAEQEEIMIVFTQLTQLIHNNSLYPINNDILEHIEHFIREEQSKDIAGGQNGQSIASAIELFDQYKCEIDLMKQAMERNRRLEDNLSSQIEQLKPEEVFALVEKLYELPINGDKIRMQVCDLNNMQSKPNRSRDTIVNLHLSSHNSPLLEELKTTFEKQ